MQMPNGGGFHFNSVTAHDDFLDQMLSTLPSGTWPDLSSSKPQWEFVGDNQAPASSIPDDVQLPLPFDETALLAFKLRQHQIGAGGSAAKSLMLQQQQQQLLLSRGLDSGLLPMPLNLSTNEPFDRSENDVVGASSFKSSNPGGDASVQALYNGFAGSLRGTGQPPNPAQHFNQLDYDSLQGNAIDSHNFGVSASVNQSPASGSGGGIPAQPRQRVRARRGQATDPHSIAERLRRERIAERMKALQELVPNGNKTDKASMLDEIIDYVKFLQLQVKVLSMSRLGGAAAVSPLLTDVSGEGGGDCVEGGGARGPEEGMKVTEQQVAKLMEEDMGSAMQYLQGKGLCLMPLSLASAISVATSHSRMNNNNNNNQPLLLGDADPGVPGGPPSSPSISVLTVQSATIVNGSVKDASSVSEP